MFLSRRLNHRGTEGTEAEVASLLRALRALRASVVLLFGTRTLGKTPPKTVICSLFIGSREVLLGVLRQITGAVRHCRAVVSTALYADPPQAAAGTPLCGRDRVALRGPKRP